MTHPMLNKEYPIISVVVTCFNDGAFIREAVNSILASNYSAYEIIIIDDASTDIETIQQLFKLRDEGYQVHIKPSNKGVSDSRNIGVRMSKGRYILPLDGDDRIRSDYLIKAVKSLDAGADVVYCNAQRFGDDHSIRKFHSFSLPQLLASNFITSCSAYRKEFWEKSGGYDTNVPNLEDWEFWIAMAKAGATFRHIDEVLFEYRARKDSRNSECLNAEKRQEAVAYICNKHAALYAQHASEIVPALYYIIASFENSLTVHKQLLSDNFVIKLIKGMKLLFSPEGLRKILSFIKK